MGSGGRGHDLLNQLQHVTARCGKEGGGGQGSLVKIAAAYVQVVLQRLRSGSAVCREAVVVLEGVCVGQQLFHLPARVGQLAPDGAELGQGDPRCWRRDRIGGSEKVWLRPAACCTIITVIFTCVDRATWLESDAQ